MVGGEVPPHTVYLDTRKVRTHRRRRVGERAHVSLEHLDRALLRSFVKQAMEHPAALSRWNCIIDRARVRL